MHMKIYLIVSVSSQAYPLTNVITLNFPSFKYILFKSAISNSSIGEGFNILV